MKNKEKGRFLYNILYFFKSVYRKIKGMRLLERIIERQKRLAGYDDEMPTKSARAGYVFGMARIVAVFLFIGIPFQFCFLAEEYSRITTCIICLRISGI